MEKDRETRLKELKSKKIIYVDDSNRKIGGQQAGLQYFPTVVEHKDLNIKISVGYFRPNHKNRELAITLFDLAFEELIQK